MSAAGPTSVRAAVDAVPLRYHVLDLPGGGLTPTGGRSSAGRPGPTRTGRAADRSP